MDVYLNFFFVVHDQGLFLVSFLNVFMAQLWCALMSLCFLLDVTGVTHKTLVATYDPSLCGGAFPIRASF